MTETSKKKRLINFIVDLIVIGVLMEVTFRIEEVVESKEAIKMLRVIIVCGGYYIPMEYFFGKTVGKIITKSKVVSSDGSRISFRTSVIRNLCRLIPFEFASLALGYDAKAWHDTLSNTCVVEERE
jgi:uncharacterized RDD family membrane protein YckC